MRATSSLQSRLEPVITRHGLTAWRFGVLEALLHLGPLHQQELAIRRLVSKGNITLVVRNLVCAPQRARRSFLAHAVNREPRLNAQVASPTYHTAAASAFANQ